LYPTSQQDNRFLAQQLEIILESLPCRIIITDPDGYVVYFSREVRSNFGRSVMGKKFAEVFPHDPIKHTLITLETGREFNNDTYKTTIRDRDYIFATSTRRLYDNDGTFMGVLSLSIDVTEQSLLEQKMAALQKLELLGELAASTAHEIRNPVTVLRGFLQLLEAGDLERTTALSYIEIMKEELSAIENTIHEFLNLSKAQTPDFVPVEIRDILNEIYPLANNLARSIPVEISFRDTTGNAVFETDKKQLKQVLMNVIINAVHAVPPYTGKVDLTVFDDVSLINAFMARHAHYISSQTFTFQTDNLYFVIKDNGCGIPAEDLKKVGTIFYSTKSAGTGIGLTVSQKIVSAHKGQLYFLSKDGEGTVVIIKLPIHQS